MRIAFGSTVDQSYFQTAPAGDFEIIFSFSLFSAATHMYGPMIISTTGAGVGASPYDNGQSVFQANLSGYQYSSSGNNVPLHSVGYMDMQKIWIGLKKVGTAYSCRYSQNGSTWSPYTATTTNAFTVDRIGFGRFLGSGSTHIMEVDRFNVI